MAPATSTMKMTSTIQKNWRRRRSLIREWLQHYHFIEVPDITGTESRQNLSPSSDQNPENSPSAACICFPLRLHSSPGSRWSREQLPPRWAHRRHGPVGPARPHFQCLPVILGENRCPPSTKSPYPDSQHLLAAENQKKSKHLKPLQTKILYIIDPQSVLKLSASKRLLK